MGYLELMQNNLWKLIENDAILYKSIITIFILLLIILKIQKNPKYPVTTGNLYIFTGIKLGGLISLIIMRLFLENIFILQIITQIIVILATILAITALPFYIYFIYQVIKERGDKMQKIFIYGLTLLSLFSYWFFLIYIIIAILKDFLNKSRRKKKDT